MPHDARRDALTEAIAAIQKESKVCGVTYQRGLARAISVLSCQLESLREAAGSASLPPAPVPDSADWWREIAQGLGLRLFKANQWMNEAWVDLHHWAAFARRQMREMPNWEHVPYGPTEAGVNATENLRTRVPKDSDYTPLRTTQTSPAPVAGSASQEAAPAEVEPPECLFDLLRAFEPAVSSRIPHPTEVLNKIRALQAAPSVASGWTRVQVEHERETWMAHRHLRADMFNIPNMLSAYAALLPPPRTAPDRRKGVTDGRS